MAEQGEAGFFRPGRLFFGQHRQSTRVGQTRRQSVNFAARAFLRHRHQEAIGQVGIPAAQRHAEIKVIEAEALETSSLVGVPIREAKLPDGVIVGAIVRGAEVIIPRGDTLTRPNDLVVIFARPDAVKKVEKLFAVKLEFF